MSNVATSLLSHFISSDGTVKVSLHLLTPGEQFLRSTSDAWVERLKRSMLANGKLYISSPFVAVVNVPKEEFDKTKVWITNMFYADIGTSSHQL